MTNSAKRVGFRTRQAAMSLGIRIMAQREPDCLIGKGRLKDLPFVLTCDGHKKPLIMTTPGMLRRGSLSVLLEMLRAAGFSYSLFTDIRPDPLIKNVEAAVTAYRENACDSIVAIGGGSVMDCAKVAAARIACPGMGVRRMKGLMKIHTKLPDLYAVPTTAGTGSEATAAAVITDIVRQEPKKLTTSAAPADAGSSESAGEKVPQATFSHYKYAVSDPCLIPKVAILDPELLLTLPPRVTADTGMDALTHAVEAFVNRFATPSVNVNAIDAVSTIMTYLPVSFVDGANLEARKQMLLASYKAGVAFTNNYVGYVHAIAHAVGALYDIPHGNACAAILPCVLEMYGSAVHKKLAILARECGITAAEAVEDVIAKSMLDDRKNAATTRRLVTNPPKAAEKADALLAAAFIGKIRAMNAALGIPSTIDALKKEDYDVIIDRAMAEANPTYPVPAIWDREEFTSVLEHLTK